MYPETSILIIALFCISCIHRHLTLCRNLAMIKNKDLSKIKEVQKNSLIKVLKKKNIPYQEFIINKKDEETLGELFSWFMIETALVGKLLGLNPFNQPAVEQVKILTKKHLS